MESKLSKTTEKYRPKRSPVLAVVKAVSKRGSFGQLAAAAEEGLLAHSPVPSDNGVNETQLIRGKDGAFVAVFKPAEPQPAGDCGDFASVEHGLTPEEVALREVAAFEIDRKNFFGVPLTGLAEISYSGFHSGEVVKQQPVVVRCRRGSLQAWVQTDGSAEDVCVSRFPVSAVHRIAILDLILLNGDRHEGNILYKKTPQGFELVPIDHGYCLPYTLDKCWFSWLTWPQAKMRFGKEELEFIQGFDAEFEARALKKLGIAEECIRNMRLSTALLKCGAEAGLTAFDIGAMVCRVGGTSVPSELERLVAQHRALSNRILAPRRETRSHDILMELVSARIRSEKLRGPSKTNNLLREAEDLDVSKYSTVLRAVNSRRASTPLASPRTFRRL